MKFIVKVKLKHCILDPQGATVKQALHHLGFSAIQEVRIGKYIEITVDEKDPQRARQIVDEASKKLLANAIIETYEVEPEEPDR